MGHPKKQRRKYEHPLKHWSKGRIESERRLLKTYGLRRKRELWKAEAILRTMRRQARELSASLNEKKERDLIGRLKKLGLIIGEEGAGLTDTLVLKVENILDRRLQTLVVKKNLANTLKQARQFIVHGKVRIGERKIPWPSYLVPSELEPAISLDEAVKNKLQIRGEGKREGANK